MENPRAAYSIYSWDMLTHKTPKTQLDNVPYVENLMAPHSEGGYGSYADVAHGLENNF